nr:RNA-directed DNA polymerase, eukaryota, reverse transcriptase zinc-binding domain protein [Tanacetum cinerariifolium]
LRSKEDDVQKISSSVFVINFPEQFSAKDLWNTCKVYGHVVDTYIPDRRSKIGKRFGFVRFINAFDMERLVNNLCTVWTGKLKLHANVARYQRDSGMNNYQRLNKRTNPTGVKETIDGTPTMVLDESCLNNEEFSLCLLGKVTEFASLTNLKVVLAKEGFESFKMVYRGKTCWVRTIEVPGLLPNFEDDCDDDDFESNDGTRVAEGPGESVGKCSDLEGKSDSEAIPETRFEDAPMDKFDDINSIPHSKPHPTYPPGFTPNDNAEDNINTSNVEPVEHGHNGDKEEGEFVVSQNQDRNDMDVDANESTCSGHFKKSNGPRTGGSIIQLIEDLVNVGQTMGYDMTRCMKNMENIIESQGVAGELSEKRTLWDYLCFTICNWDGDVVTMGYFNEVRDSSERFGSVFNKHGAKLFNDFIAKAGLTEVPLWYRSDHRPILLSESIYDYGLIPFKFYHSWFEIDGFDKLVKDSWNEIHVVDNNAYVRFIKKLKLLKERIKAWNSSYRELTNCMKNTLKTELTNLDSVLDRGEGIDTDVTRRSDAVDLEREVSKEEVKRAVWDCGIDKAPGPDCFTFGFYRRFWNLIECDVVKAVKWFFLHERIPSGGNSSFITLIPKVSNANLVKDFRPISLIGSVYKIVAKILANRLVLVLGDLVSDTQSSFLKERQILDGPFFLNEVIQWCKKKKKQSMIFKVDFEKAYDSVRWDFVDIILKKFGFGEKWCKWIHSCLQSSRGSILINGSPTPEFQFFKGLKQGDPLSPFLFILVTESLHLSFQRVCVGPPLKKSKLMGIAVDASRVEQAIRQIGYMALKMPFKYLGSVVRDRMSRVKFWNDVIDNLVTRLSRWKLKTISIGGRLTLFKSVLGSTPVFHMSIYKVPMAVLRTMEGIRARFFNGADNKVQKSSWVSWNQVMASKDAGGLGVASLFALNRGLMFKWVWRFITQKNSLWAKVITTIHGDDGKIGKTMNPTFPSIWLNIIQEVAVMKTKGIDVVSFIKPKCGGGTNISFWNDA